MPFQLKHFTQEQVFDALNPQQRLQKGIPCLFDLHNPKIQLERLLPHDPKLTSLSTHIYNEFRPWTTGVYNRTKLANTFDIPIFTFYERNGEVALKGETNEPPTRWSNRTKKIRHIEVIAGNLTDPDHIQQLSDAIASDRALSKIHAERSKFVETPAYDNTKVKHYILYLTKPSALDGITQPEITIPEEKLDEYELVQNLVVAKRNIKNAQEQLAFNTTIAKDAHFAIYNEELKDI